MRKKALAGAIASALGVLSPAAAQDEFSAPGPVLASASQNAPVVTDSHIARLKSALRLTPEQRVHWVPVETALRALARQQRREVTGGFVQRMRERASAVAGTAIQLQRLAAAARPLIGTLSEEQKNRAIGLMRRAGFERMVAMF
jgi:hypothetical protein